MKNHPLQEHSLVPHMPSFSRPALRAADPRGGGSCGGRPARCLRDFMAAASPAPDHFAYGLIAGVRTLVRYHHDAQYRRYLRGAEVILAASAPTAWLIRQLQGVRVPICSAAQVASTMLELARPMERILRVGSAPGWHASALARRLRDIRCHPHDAAKGCIDFIEANAPFRFCLLTMASPRQELIAHEVLRRGLALGLVLCVGPC